MREINNMEKIMGFIVGLIVFIGVTVFVYTSWGFEITVIYLIMDASMSISLANLLLQKIVSNTDKI